MRQITMLQDRAYEFMKDKIREGALDPNEIYSLNQIARDMGISKTPLRDAVMMLANEHYIDIIPSRGFMVHKLTEADVRETYQFRHAIEIYCLRQLAENINTDRGQEYYGKLKKLMDTQAQLIREEGDARQIREMDYQLHKTMVEYIDNHSILEMYRNYMYRISQLNVKALEEGGRRKGTVIEHEEILRAVKDQDYEALEKVVSDHIKVAMGINLRQM